MQLVLIDYLKWMKCDCFQSIDRLKWFVSMLFASPPNIGRNQETEKKMRFSYSINGWNQLWKSLRKQSRRKIVIKQFFSVRFEHKTNSYTVILRLPIVSRAWEKCTARDNWMNKYLILSAIEKCLFVFDGRREKNSTNKRMNERAARLMWIQTGNGIAIIGISFGLFFFILLPHSLSLLWPIACHKPYTWKIIKKLSISSFPIP